MEEIELKFLLQVIRRRWWVVLVITVIAIAASAVYSFFIIDPLYQSNTSIYIGKNIESQGGIAYNDVLLNDRLVNDYRELVKSRLISDTVIRELKLPDMDSGKMSAKLSVNSKKDTRLIEISATDKSPETARAIADKVAEVFKEKAVEIMQVENAQIIDKAMVPEKPIKPNKKLNLAIAGVLGLMLSFGLIFVIEYFDDTLKTPEDVQKYLDLPVIGTIPVFPE